MRTSPIVEKARELKRLNYTNRKIAKELFVNPQDISRWTNKIDPVGYKQKGIVQKQTEERIKFFNYDRIKISKISNKQALIYASLLYWCEGSKYPSDSRVNFTSSDPQMQIVFWTLMRKIFELNESKLRVWMQIHTSHNQYEIYKYWSSILRIPQSQFFKPKVTVKKGGKYRQIYYGTCSVRYTDYRILLRLMGVYTRFSRVVI